MLYYIRLYYALLCYVMLYHITSCHIISYHIISYHIILYYIMLYYVMLCYVISCYGDKLCSLRVDLQICDEQGRLPSWSTDFEGRCWWKKRKCWSSSFPSSHRLMTKSWFSHDLVLWGFLFQSTLKNTSSKLYWECLLNMSQFLRIREHKIVGSDTNRVNH